MGAYTPRVPVEPAPQTPPPLGDHGTTTRRRRAPSKAEQERRKAWAAEWGKVGKDWKQKQLAKERA